MLYFIFALLVPSIDCQRCTTKQKKELKKPSIILSYYHLIVIIILVEKCYTYKSGDPTIKTIIFYTSETI